MRRKTRGIKANQRFAFILFVFMVILTVLFGRVLYWKVVHGAEFVERGYEKIETALSLLGGEIRLTEQG